MKTLESSKPQISVKTITPGADRLKAQLEQAKKGVAQGMPQVPQISGDRGRG